MSKKEFEGRPQKEKKTSDESLWTTRSPGGKRKGGKGKGVAGKRDSKTRP